VPPLLSSSLKCDNPAVLGSVTVNYRTTLCILTENIGLNGSPQCRICEVISDGLFLATR
jgi:hypothetical protein